MSGKRFTTATKLALYQQYKKSNLSKCAFADQNGVSKSAFSRWVNEIEAEQQPQQSRFDNVLKPIISVNDVQEKTPLCEISNIDHIEFIMPNKVIIKLPITKDLHLLAEMLALIVA